MSTYFSAPLSLPTASVPAFIALAGPAESARESLSAEGFRGRWYFERASADAPRTDP